MKRHKKEGFKKRLDGRLNLIQTNSSGMAVPSANLFRRWISLAIDPRWDSADISLVFLDEQKAKETNAQYRGKDYATNVLSFAYNEGVESEGDMDSLLYNGFGSDALRGDLVICPLVVEREAKEQNKTLKEHYAHLAIHGALHLQGYDHIEEEEAMEMENLERKLLAFLGFKDPYEPMEH